LEKNKKKVAPKANCRNYSLCLKASAFVQLASVDVPDLGSEAFYLLDPG
jgi:hypothetical protein